MNREKKKLSPDILTAPIKLLNYFRHTCSKKSRLTEWSMGLGSHAIKIIFILQGLPQTNHLMLEFEVFGKQPLQLVTLYVPSSCLKLLNNIQECYCTKDICRMYWDPWCNLLVCTKKSALGKLQLWWNSTFWNICKKKWYLPFKSLQPLQVQVRNNTWVISFDISFLQLKFKKKNYCTMEEVTEQRCAFWSFQLAQMLSAEPISFCIIWMPQPTKVKHT